MMRFLRVIARVPPSEMMYYYIMLIYIKRYYDVTHEGGTRSMSPYFTGPKKAQGQ